MRHVDAEGMTVLQHVSEICDDWLSLTRAMLSSPHVEPSRVILAIHQWAGFLKFPQLLERGNDEGLSIE